MAYVRTPNETWQKNKQGQGLHSEGGGAVAGGGSTVSNQATGTKAGNAAGWYNISDFLGANKDNQVMQNQIKETGNKYIDSANEEAGALYEQYNTHKRPEVQAFDPSRLGVGGYDETAVQSGMNQDYDPFDVQGAMNLSSTSMNPYNTIQSGSVKSLVDFNAQGMKPNAQYTGGMHAMDTALLGGDYDFVNNYGNEFKRQFENEVLNPFNAQKEEFTTNEANLDKSFEDAQGAWRGGVNEWLEGRNSSVDTAYNNMQKSYNDIINADPRSYVDDQTKAYYDAQKAGNEKYGTDFFIPEFSDYINQTGGSIGGPSRGNAAFDALGGAEGIDYYNALSSLYNDASGGESPYSPYSGSEWTAPTYEFDKDAYMAAARSGADITQSADEYTAPAPWSPSVPDVSGAFKNNPARTGAQDIYDNTPKTEQDILAVGGDTARAAENTKNTINNFIGLGGGGGSSSIAEWRDQLAKTNPEAADWTDDRVRQAIRQLVAF
jgi:hypothetical protein